jgi:hypothetical protein
MATAVGSLGSLFRYSLLTAAFDTIKSMARKTFAAVVLSAVFLLGASPAPDGKRWWSYVEALANDQMKGRDTGSPEHLKAAQYVAEQFRKAGLTAAVAQGFLQPVKFLAWKIVEPECSLDLIRSGKAERLALGEDAYIARGAQPAELVEAPLVFAGYGLTVPEKDYDDFSGLDVRGKIVVMIGGWAVEYPGSAESALPERARAKPFSGTGRRGGNGYYSKSQHLGRALEPSRIGPFSGGHGAYRSSGGRSQRA